jgi:hypothetical protein
MKQNADFVIGAALDGGQNMNYCAYRQVIPQAGMVHGG